MGLYKHRFHPWPKEALHIKRTRRMWLPPGMRGRIRRRRRMGQNPHRHHPPWPGERYRMWFLQFQGPA